MAGAPTLINWLNLITEISDFYVSSGQNEKGFNYHRLVGKLTYDHHCDFIKEELLWMQSTKLKREECLISTLTPLLSENGKIIIFGMKMTKHLQNMTCSIF